MDEDKITIEEGLLVKSADISPNDVTDDDLRKINKYTLSPLKAEDVFTFKTVLGDNETDDRNYEPFNLNAIKDMARLYPGKTVIKDHNRRADNQVARVYDAEMITEPKLTKAGEPFTRIVTKNYMLRTQANADLIKEIEGGIKKEVSTGVRPTKLICNICGADNLKTYCPHWPGRAYDKADGEKATCLMTIDGVKEAYELSLVAVPAQVRAGACKGYGVQPPEEIPEETKETEVTEETKEEEDPTIGLRIRAVESFVFAEKEAETNEQENA